MDFVFIQIQEVQYSTFYWRQWLWLLVFASYQYNSLKWPETSLKSFYHLFSIGGSKGAWPCLLSCNPPPPPPHLRLLSLQLLWPYCWPVFSCGYFGALTTLSTCFWISWIHPGRSLCVISPSMIRCCMQIWRLSLFHISLPTRLSLLLILSFLFELTIHFLNQVALGSISARKWTGVMYCSSLDPNPGSELAENRLKVLPRTDSRNLQQITTT